MTLKQTVGFHSFSHYLTESTWQRVADYWCCAQILMIILHRCKYVCSVFKCIQSSSPNSNRCMSTYTTGACNWNIMSQHNIVTVQQMAFVAFGRSEMPLNQHSWSFHSLTPHGFPYTFAHRGSVSVAHTRKTRFLTQTRTAYFNTSWITDRSSNTSYWWTPVRHHS